MLEENKIHQGDCMELMKHIPDKSVDMILCDLPYGVTACGWDKVLPLDDLWKQYKRIIKDDGVVVLTASQPFTTDLINSNREWFKYCWVWNKTKSGNFAIAKYQPLRITEDILVFYKGSSRYFPIMNKAKFENKRPRNKTYDKKTDMLSGFSSGIFKSDEQHNEDLRYPTNILTFATTEAECNAIVRTHPTQKPIALFRYLIKTYTQEGELVLDNCIGSGTTAVACKQANRRFIGIEINQEYVDIANERLKFTTVSDFYSNESSNRN